MILKIVDIKTGGMQIRAEMKEDVVLEYVEAIASGVKFPPVVVFDDGNNLWLADGFHRMEACLRSGFKVVKAEVKEGGRIEALKYAFKANSTHGLRMSNDDKRQAVLLAYENREALGLGEVPSANSVAEMIGVSNHFVANQLGSVPSWKEATERQGSDGRKRSLPVPTKAPQERMNLGPRFPVPPSTQGNTGSSGGDGGGKKEDEGFGGGSLSPETKHVPAVVTDMIGNRVPVNLVELWMRRTEILEMVKNLQKSRLALTKAQEAGDPLFGNFNFSSAVMHLDNATAHIKGAVPHCVCGYCRGIGCKVCGSGLLPLIQYERLPREMKKGGV